MNRFIRLVFVAILTALLASCAGVPKLPLRAEAKQSIKRIALVETPEPKSYSMNPGSAPGGAALYAFGAIGGAILGGIEASRAEAAATRFTEAVAPLKPALADTMLAQLEKGLIAKGYQVTRVPMPPKTEDGKELDVTKIEGEFDAALFVSFAGGYSAASSDVVPNIFAVASLYSRNGNEKLFNDRYLYGRNRFVKFTLIEPESKFSLASVDVMYGNISVAVDGMRSAVTQIAERVLAEL